MSALILIVCLTGVVSSDTNKVTKHEGETVHFSVSTTQRPLQNYIWLYGKNVPAKAIAVVTNKQVIVVNGTRFGTRLSTDVETGSLSISNLTTEDSGLFGIQILTETGTVLKEYNLTVTDNQIQTINVLEGKNVTMRTRVEKLDCDHHVRWTQGPDFGGKEIVLYEKNYSKIDDNLKDFLSLDQISGSLTIVKITNELAGFYCVEMRISGYPHLNLQYEIKVYGMVSTPNISKSHYTDNPWSCHIICSVSNQPDVTLSLFKGDALINRTSSSDVSTVLSLSLDVHSPSENTYRCEAANPVSKRDASFNTTDLCPTPQTGILKADILVVVAVLVAVAAVVGVLVWVFKQKKRRRATCTGCVETQDQNWTHELCGSQNSEDGSSDPESSTDHMGLRFRNSPKLRLQLMNITNVIKGRGDNVGFELKNLVKDPLESYRSCDETTKSNSTEQSQ